jgi:uncharacterized membrane protein (DUF2068 family)
MSDTQKNPLSPKKRAPTLYFIIGIKSLKGLAALLLAVGAYRLTDNDLPDDFQKLLLFLHLDPEKKFFLDLADRVADITPANLKWLAAGSILYALFMLLQAGGLWLRVGWVVWLVIGESAFFVPIEIFELVHHPSWLPLTVLSVNVLIVWYLFANRARIIRHHHH